MSFLSKQAGNARGFLAKRAQQAGGYLAKRAFNAAANYAMRTVKRPTAADAIEKNKRPRLAPGLGM